MDWKIGGLEDWWIGGLEDWWIGGLVDWEISEFNHTILQLPNPPMKSPNHKSSNPPMAIDKPHDIKMKSRSDTIRIGGISR